MTSRPRCLTTHEPKRLVPTLPRGNVLRAALRRAHGQTGELFLTRSLMLHFTINCVVWLARYGDCRPLVAGLPEAGRGHEPRLENMLWLACFWCGWPL